jgi:hypothetical protein
VKPLEEVKKVFDEYRELHIYYRELLRPYDSEIREEVYTKILNNYEYGSKVRSYVEAYGLDLHFDFSLNGDKIRFYITHEGTSKGVQATINIQNNKVEIGHKFT